MEFGIDKKCFACGVENEWGLKLSFKEENGCVSCDFIPDFHYQGYKDVVHGGIITTALDEAMFYAIYILKKKKVVTAEITVRFKKPVRVGEKYRIYGIVEGKKGRIFYTIGRMLNGKGEVCAEAKGKFIEVR